MTDCKELYNYFLSIRGITVTIQIDGDIAGNTGFTGVLSTVCEDYAILYVLNDHVRRVIRQNRVLPRCRRFWHHRRTRPDYRTQCNCSCLGIGVSLPYNKIVSVVFTEKAQIQDVTDFRSLLEHFNRRKYKCMCSLLTSASFIFIIRKVFLCAISSVGRAIDS